MATLPLAPGVVVESAECSGVPGRAGYGCVILGDGPAGAELDLAKMAGWEETSWDEVPGRVQQSWRRGEEQVGLAVHTLEGRTRWSASYYVGAVSTAPYVGSNRGAAPDPDAVLPPRLAALPLPPGAQLWRAEQRTETITSATLSVRGDPAEIMALYQDMPGWTSELRSRTPRSRALRWRRDDLEVGVVLFIEETGDHTLVLSSNPAAG